MFFNYPMKKSIVDKQGYSDTSYISSIPDELNTGTTSQVKQFFSVEDKFENETSHKYNSSQERPNQAKPLPEEVFYARCLIDTLIVDTDRSFNKVVEAEKNVTSLKEELRSLKNLHQLMINQLAYHRALAEQRQQTPNLQLKDFFLRSILSGGIISVPSNLDGFLTGHNNINVVTQQSKPKTVIKSTRSPKISSISQATDEQVISSQPYVGSTMKAGLKKRIPKNNDTHLKNSCWQIQRTVNKIKYEYESNNFLGGIMKKSPIKLETSSRKLIHDNCPCKLEPLDFVPLEDDNIENEVWFSTSSGHDSSLNFPSTSRYTD